MSSAAVMGPPVVGDVVGWPWPSKNLSDGITNMVYRDITADCGRQVGPECAALAPIIERGGC